MRRRERTSPIRERDTAALSLFADEMKAAREQRGWSQADLADQIPYSLSTISMVEALHRVPTRDQSSYSGNSGGNCVEAGAAAHLIAVRDSKDPDGARLAFGREAWEAFAAGLKADTN